MKNFYIISGLMGSGKDTVVSELIIKKPMKFLKSYSTRKKRFDDEDTHTFINKYEFGKIKNKIAVSCINNEWYTTTEDQINNSDIGIFDNKGAGQALFNYRGKKQIYIIYIDVSENIRFRRMSDRGDNITDVLERLKHDSSVNERIKKCADIVVDNNSCDLQKTLQNIINFIEEKEGDTA